MTNLENQKIHKMDSRAQQVEKNIRQHEPVNRIIARAEIHKDLKKKTKQAESVPLPEKPKQDLSHLGKHD